VAAFRDEPVCYLVGDKNASDCTEFLFIMSGESMQKFIALESAPATDRAHVTNSESGIARQMLGSWPPKLHNPISRMRVPLEHTQNIQDNVLSADIPRWLAGERDANRLGRLEPCLPGRECGHYIRCA
jgi:hypothetical protein